MLSYNSLTNKDLTYERSRTKDYVRNFTLFMQNEPKFQKPKMNLNNVLTKIGKIEPNPLFKKGLYQFCRFAPTKTNPNEPKTNPIQTQSDKPR